MGDLKKLKIVLKDSLKAVPIMGESVSSLQCYNIRAHAHTLFTGWAMQCMWYLFISRKWTVDEKLMKDGIAYYSDTELPVQLLVFPEGTDLSPSNKEKGHRYASEHGLQKYNYVLHPRTKGFCLCAQEFSKFKGPPPTLVNISVGYLGEMPQNERDLAAGRWPNEIHFCAEQEPLASLPTDEEGLAKWLQARWQVKEKQLENFYKNKKFSSPYVGDALVKASHSELKKVMLTWTLFCLYIIYNFLTNSFYWYYFPIWTTIFLLMNHGTKGIDSILQRRYKLFARWWN